MRDLKSLLFLFLRRDAAIGLMFHQEDQKALDEEEDAAYLEFEKTRAAKAIVRKKHIDVTNEEAAEFIRGAVQQHAIYEIPRAEINPRYQRHCRVVSFHSSWLKSSSCTMDYSPILIRRGGEDDFRQRAVGVTAGSGPCVTVFDLEQGKKLYDIEEHSSCVHSVMISRPAPHLKVMPVVVTGSHSGLMKCWDLQSGSFVRSFGDKDNDGNVLRQNIHSGPVKVVYVHDCQKSLAFSAASNKLFVWYLESGALIYVKEDHTKDISAICCYQYSDTFSSSRFPASVVTGGRDSKLIVYSLKNFELVHTLDNQSGPINDIKISVMTLNENSKNKLPLIVAACFDGRVHIWGLGSGEWLSCIELGGGSVNSIAVLDTPRAGLILGHADGSVQLVNARTNEALCSLSQTVSAKEDRASPPVTTLSCTMHPRPMVLCGFQDCRVVIWDLVGGGTKDAIEIHHILSEHLRWKDPLLVHDTDSDDSEG